MGKYSNFISETRRSVETPTSLVENGKAVFGTFNKEFVNLNLLDCKSPTDAPNLANRLKLSLWDAIEIHFKDAYLLSVVSDMGLFGIAFNLLWDEKENKLTYWNEFVMSSSKENRSGVTIASNLLDGKKTKIETKKTKMIYTANFEKGLLKYDYHQEVKGLEPINGSLTMNRISLPSIVSIPFGENRPLYSQKDLLKCEGEMKIGNRVYKCDKDTVAVIDDHRGYYPRKTHYDWLTFLGRNNDGKLMGINLTRNQSIDQEKYNENLIWFENKSSLLPPITFSHTRDSHDFKDPKSTPAFWNIKDEHDMVNITVEIENMKPNLMNKIFIRMDYFIVFGTVVEGYVRDEDGKKYDLKGLKVMGEDKTLVL